MLCRPDSGWLWGKEALPATRCVMPSRSDLSHVCANCPLTWWRCHPMGVHTASSLHLPGLCFPSSQGGTEASRWRCNLQCQPPSHTGVSAALLLIQLSMNMFGKATHTDPNNWVPCYPCGRHRWRSWCLALPWLLQHFESEPMRRNTPHPTSLLLLPFQKNRF